MLMTIWLLKLTLFITSAEERTEIYPKSNHSSSEKITKFPQDLYCLKFDSNSDSVQLRKQWKIHLILNRANLTNSAEKNKYHLKLLTYAT